jgi:N-acetylmuramoyl-L-alanine amidase
MKVRNCAHSILISAALLWCSSDLEAAVSKNNRLATSARATSALKVAARRPASRQTTVRQIKAGKDSAKASAVRVKAVEDAESAPAELNKVALQTFGKETRLLAWVSTEPVWTGVRMTEGALRVYFDVKAQTVLPRATVLAGEGDLVRRVRVAEWKPGITRIVLDLVRDVDWRVQFLPNPGRLLIDLRPRGSSVAPTRAEPAAKDYRQYSVEERPFEKRPVLLDVPPINDDASNLSRQRPRVVGGISGAAIGPPKVPMKDVSKSPATVGLQAGAQRPNMVNSAAGNSTAATRTANSVVVPPVSPTVVSAQPLRNGRQNLTRALGLKLKRIVIDPGHGGYDQGASGPTGLTEKEVALDVSLRLGELLRQRLGTQIYFTRDSDEYVALHERTAMANRWDGDLFLSIHANASRDRAARGVETFYLNFNASRDALEVATRENASSEKTVNELNDLVKQIALQEKLQESREFAAYIQSALQSHAVKSAGGMANRGVKRAPFIVLIGAKMPSILAEIGFITNPNEEERMRRSEHRQKIAEALYAGVLKYSETLSRAQVTARR